jgi:phosphohistidine phosphatase SixA
LDLASGVSKLALIPVGQPKGLCLGKEGETESWLLGELLTSLEIPVGEVIASPICRCIQTAEIAFGRIDHTNVNLVYRELVAQLDKDLAKKEMAKLFSAPTQEGKNRVIVAHKSLKIKELGISVHIGEPDTAIFKIADGKAHLVSIMKLWDWAKLLERPQQL